MPGEEISSPLQQLNIICLARTQRDPKKEIPKDVMKFQWFTEKNIIRNINIM